jgi:hypothetical protein
MRSAFLASVTLALSLSNATPVSAQRDDFREELKDAIRERVRELSERLSNELCRVVDRIFDQAARMEKRRPEGGGKTDPSPKPGVQATPKPERQDKADIARRLDELVAEAKQLEDRLAGFRERFRADDPSVRQLERRLTALRRSIEEMRKQKETPEQAPEAPAPPKKPEGGIVIEEAPDNEAELAKRPFLGVTVEPVSDNYRTLMHLAPDQGVRITEVVKGSSAAKAGLKPTDVILSIDGKNVGTFEALRDTVRSKAVGANVALGAIIDGEKVTKEIKLGSQADSKEDEERGQEPPSSGRDEEGADAGGGGLLRKLGDMLHVDAIEPRDILKHSLKGLGSDDESKGGIDSLSLEDLCAWVDALRGDNEKLKEDLPRLLKRTISGIVNGEEPVEPSTFLGAVVGPVPDALRSQFGIAESQGVLVIDVPEGSEAESLGLIRHDVVLSVDGAAVKAGAECDKRQGTATFEVLRGGKRLSLR